MFVRHYHYLPYSHSLPQMRRLTLSAASLLAWQVAPASAFAPAGLGHAPPPRPGPVARSALRALGPADGSWIASAPALAGAAASTSTHVAAGLLSSDSIKVAFSVATFFPQLPWLFLILLPNSGVTKKLLGGYGEG